MKRRGEDVILRKQGRYTRDMNRSRFELTREAAVNIRKDAGSRIRQLPVSGLPLWEIFKFRANEKGEVVVDITFKRRELVEREEESPRAWRGLLSFL